MAQQPTSSIHPASMQRGALLTTDWAAEWQSTQVFRHAPDDPNIWDARAKHFKPRETHPYAKDFIALVDAQPGESIFDMGCGAGSLAIPFAQNGHAVIAADFSPAMLATLQEGIAYHHLEQFISPLQLAWDSDWDATGLKPKSADIAIASRSIATRDLKSALLKLDRIARRRCCITLVTGSSPRYDEHIMRAIGVSVTQSRDYIYAFNILTQLGITPEIHYIDSPRRDTFDTLEEAVDDFSRMLEGGEEHRIDELRSYLKAHMVPNDHAGEPGQKGKPQGRYALDHIRNVRWAFISWAPRS